MEATRTGDVDQVPEFTMHNVSSIMGIVINFKTDAGL